MNSNSKGIKKNKRLHDIYVVYVCIKSTFNNIILSITTQSGAVLFKTSSGASGFKGPKKSTPYAAQVIADNARNWIIDHHIKAVAIKLNGPHNARDAAVRVFANNSDKRGNYVVTMITDVTKLPHNGCRPRKIRKV